MNTTKKRIMDRYEDLLNAIDAVKESPTYLNETSLEFVSNKFEHGMNHLIIKLFYFIS